MLKLKDTLSEKGWWCRFGLYEQHRSLSVCCNSYEGRLAWRSLLAHQHSGTLVSSSLKGFRCVHEHILFEWDKRLNHQANDASSTATLVVLLQGICTISLRIHQIRLYNLLQKEATLHLCTRRTRWLFVEQLLYASLNRIMETDGVRGKLKG